MDKLDPDQLLDSIPLALRQRVDRLEVFPVLDSTNSYLLRVSGPAAGKCRIAIAGQQTAGRGRSGNTWRSPPSAGIYLSIAYTFQHIPKNYSCLTLAVGIGAARALEEFGLRGVQLKWPNDLIVQSGKLGGILTELKPGHKETAVVGIGLNVDTHEDVARVSTGLGKVADLRTALQGLPDRADVAARIIIGLVQTVVLFEEAGFKPFFGLWRQYDWLDSKAVCVTTSAGDVDGVASGIDYDGALLLTNRNGTERVISGSVLLQQPDGSGQ